MAILKIARMGHPVLRRPADWVADATAPEILRLVADMIETMADAGGAGLAAPQVHVPLRVVVFHVPAARARREGGAPVPLTVLINPEIVPLADETAPGWEACLSVPGLAGMVPRFTRIRYCGLGPDGTKVEREAQGFHARVVQHECDHLDGILYPQRMTDLSLLVFADELHRSTVADGEEGPSAEEPADVD
jgi:peptide deformylase